MLVRLWLNGSIFRKEDFLAGQYNSIGLDIDDDDTSLSIDIRCFVRYVGAEDDSAVLLERVYAAVRAALEQHKDYDPDDFYDFEEEDYWRLCEYEGAILDCDEFADRSPQVVDNLAAWCEELMEDIGYLPKDMPGIIRDYIDFEGLAEELLHSDYNSIEKRDGFIVWRGNR